MGSDKLQSDADIVAQVLAGNQAQYRLLVERYQKVVFNAAYRLLGNRDETADITQETFLRAYQALASFQRDKALAPWLCRIAINLSYNRLKQQHQQPTLSLQDDNQNLIFDLPDLSAEPQLKLLQAEQQQILQQAILSLPAEQRMVIELRHFQALNYAEIALQLEISVVNVKSRLFRARKKLRQILEKDI